MEYEKWISALCSSFVAGCSDSEGYAELFELKKQKRWKQKYIFSINNKCLIKSRKRRRKKATKQAFLFNVMP